MSRTPGGDHRNPLDANVLRGFILDGADFTQVRRGIIGWAGEQGTEHLTITAGQDVDVHVTADGEMQLVCRLFAPAGLWSLPPLGDECLVLAQEGDWTAIGAPVCLWRHRLPPSNLSLTRAVLEVPADGLLIGNGATANAARVGDAVRVTIPAGTELTGTIGGSPAVFTVGAPGITCDGVIRPNTAKTKIE